jgi:hypothetical protein
MLKNTLLTAVFVACSTLAIAQYGPAGGPYQPDSVTATVDRVHADLNRGYGEWKIKKDDRERLNKAAKQLREFEHDWRKGKFNKDELDESIRAIQHVLDENHLRGEARDAVFSAVQELRRMREAYDRHEIGRR